MYQIGAVAIGRNEGDRLVRCLKSLLTHLPPGMPLVYVDSGSTDASIANAQALGVHVIDLDMSIPFTMARAYNSGLHYLCKQFSGIEYVQFIDGDCELLPGWLEVAHTLMKQEPQIAIICGNLGERHPEASIYNRLAQMEWNTSLGDVKECVGIALMRVSALQAVNGYNESLIAGEEPDLCFRLRQRGWKIRRVDIDMALHDTAMYRFSQWWQRCIRSGWAFEQGAAMHGVSNEHFRVHQSCSNWFWGLLVPLVALGAIPFTQGFSLLLLLGYPVLGWQIYRHRSQQGDPDDQARLYAIWCVFSKMPQMLGQAKFWWQRWQRKTATLIEYK